MSARAARGSEVRPASAHEYETASGSTPASDICWSSRNAPFGSPAREAARIAPL
eukprot:CAMPEP_0196704660 /NCGR_PEP_ID=MMETSP1090-20130531/58391_1 /TAXON_ID=37098 /ORGANISM="Isochrysis sp, Strain CCMP1244" /LENGTH=53 /DNA_ID=CAMNT_0042044559 /DNA_START=52 /DNA_END=213 /DNA_ORIENTATION=-